MRNLQQRNEILEHEISFNLRKGRMAEAHGLSRQRGSTGIGVEKRDFQSAMSSLPTISQWKEHLRRPGREGGFLATITTPYSWFDARNPEAICNIPLEETSSNGDDDSASDSDDGIMPPDGTQSPGADGGDRELSDPCPRNLPIGA